MILGIDKSRGCKGKRVVVVNSLGCWAGGISALAFLVAVVNVLVAVVEVVVVLVVVVVVADMVGYCNNKKKLIVNTFCHSANCVLEKGRKNIYFFSL